MFRLHSLLGLALLAALSACSSGGASGGDDASTTPSDPSASGAKTAMPDPTTTATFGAGCYWCTEAVLEQLPGVLDVTSGFMGGKVPNPTYRQVCGGDTGHAEVVQVKFDPKKISYDQLLDWFWKLHDPTTLNAQGPDHGTQYRSVIFYHSDEQRRLAEASRTAHQKDFERPIVTEITAAGPFYKAELDHQDYYVNNKSQGYCQIVIKPKLQHLGLKN